MGTFQDRRRIVDTVFGAMAAEVLFTAARLRVADGFSDGGRDVAELAVDFGADPAAFARLLRAMAAMGLLTEPAPGRFLLTGAGELLRSDHPESLRSFAEMFGDPAMLAGWRELEASVRTGRTTFDKVYGTTIFEYLGTRPELSARFNASMRQATLMLAAILPHHYDFSRFRAVADIGGGDGTLLAAILTANPTLQGLLFDSPEGLAQARDTLGTAGVRDRVACVSGDFFDSVVSEADLYLLKSVIHDWNDERSATILRNVRRVIPDDGRLLIIEPVVPDTVDGTMPLMTYLSDLNMMVNTGGRERTRDEFERLCAASGFRVDCVTALPGAAFSIVEAAPA